MFAHPVPSPVPLNPQAQWLRPPGSLQSDRLRSFTDSAGRDHDGVSSSSLKDDEFPIPMNCTRHHPAATDNSFFLSTFSDGFRGDVPPPGVTGELHSAPSDFTSNSRVLPTANGNPSDSTSNPSVLPAANGNSSSVKHKGTGLCTHTVLHTFNPLGLDAHTHMTPHSHTTLALHASPHLHKHLQPHSGAMHTHAPPHKHRTNSLAHHTHTHGHRTVTSTTSHAMAHKTCTSGP